MKHLEYPERLQSLKLPTLAYRKTRGDLMKLILHNLYDHNSVIIALVCSHFTPVFMSEKQEVTMVTDLNYIMKTPD